MLIKREVRICDIPDCNHDAEIFCNICQKDFCSVHYGQWRKMTGNAKAIELCPTCEVKMLEAIRLGKL